MLAAHHIWLDTSWVGKHVTLINSVETVERHNPRLNPFRVPKSLPILTTNKFVPKQGFQL